MTVDNSYLVSSYLDWLKSNIKITEVGGFQEISTPFLDRHNDFIQIYVKQEGEKLILTDDGYTVSDLIMSGCDISSPRRKDVLNTILNGFGVRLSKEELVVETRKEDFPQKKHSLIQAILSVNDMFMMSSHRVASLFLEDVERYFDLHEIRYTPSVQFVGKSGFSHRFDFVIPASKKRPERLLRAINNPNKDKATGVLFAWNDTKEIRKHDTSMYVILNDTDKKVSSEVSKAFSEYGVNTISWSRREQYIQDLIS